MATVSELYGKKVISTTGHWIGEVHHVVIDLENKAVSHLLLSRLDTSKDKSLIREIFKNSVEYNRVKKVLDTVLVTPK